MFEIETSNLKKLPTRYEASRAFKKSKKVYLYFKPKNIHYEDYVYNLFNSSLDFNKNFELLMTKNENLKDYWTLYTDNTKYDKPLTKNSNQIQLELF